VKLPGPIRRTPELDRWLAFNEDGTITVATGKVDIGQGLSTALAMIAAEELDVDLARIRVQTADTELTPNEFVTAGSMSIEDSGSAVRVASATAREMLLTLAAELLGVHAGSLSVEDGIISSSESNEQTDYWSLQGGHPFSARIVEVPVLKPASAYRVVGHRQTRLDLPGKVRGDVAFVHDMRLPHMRHGALVKPPSPTARLLDAPERLPHEGAVVVRDGSFLGVVADTESNADSARSWLGVDAPQPPARGHSRAPARERQREPADPRWGSG
jgi:nicotinate dehydrogenase subunit B